MQEISLAFAIYIQLYTLSMPNRIPYLAFHDQNCVNVCNKKPST